MENALLNFFSCVAPALFQSHATFYNNNNFQDTNPFLRRNFHVKTPTRTTKISSQQNQSHMSPLSLCYAYIYLNAFRFPNGKKNTCLHIDFAIHTSYFSIELEHFGVSTPRSRLITVHFLPGPQPCNDSPFIQHRN